MILDETAARDATAVSLRFRGPDVIRSDQAGIAESPVVQAAPGEKMLASCSAAEFADFILVDQNKIPKGILLTRPECRCIFRLSIADVANFKTGEMKETPMTNTHISHFGLNYVNETQDNILMEGSLGACKRMAFAHGLEVLKEEGRVIGCDAGVAIYDTTETVRYILTRGMIMKVPGGWMLVMNLCDWKSAA